MSEFESMTREQLINLLQAEPIEGEVVQETAVLPVLSPQIGHLQTQPALSELLERFFSEQFNIRENSKATYKRQLKGFSLWIADTGRSIYEMAAVDIAAYRDYLSDERKLSIYTVNGYLTAVKKLFKWLEARIIAQDVAKEVKALSRPEGRAKDILEKSEIRKIIATAGAGRHGLRDAAIVNLMARTGLRDIEISRADIGDIRSILANREGELVTQSVLYVQGKGKSSKSNYVLLTPEALAPIEAYLASRGGAADTEPLFTSAANKNNGERLTTRSISRIIKTAMLDSGINSKRKTAHSLRHSAITYAILAGASLHEAQAMARHASPVTTMGYFDDVNRAASGAELRVTF